MDSEHHRPLICATKHKGNYEGDLPIVYEKVSEKENQTSEGGTLGSSGLYLEKSLQSGCRGLVGGPLEVGSEQTKTLNPQHKGNLLPWRASTSVGMEVGWRGRDGASGSGKGIWLSRQCLGKSVLG